MSNYLGNARRTRAGWHYHLRDHFYDEGLVQKLRRTSAFGSWARRGSVLNTWRACCPGWRMPWAQTFKCLSLMDSTPTASPFQPAPTPTLPFVDWTGGRHRSLASSF